MHDPAPRSLIAAVISATERARFLPATRAGKPIDIYVVLMVLVDTTLGEPMILAVPNNGVERHKYGLLYTGPQRVLKKGEPRLYDPTVVLSTRGDMLVWMQFQVDDRGAVRDFRVAQASYTTSRTLRELRKRVSKWTFLPGEHEGRPTAMLYVEPYFD
jgi:hypothetical protein